MPPFAISLFGSFSIDYENESINAITSPKIHGLIAYLALSPSRAYPRAEMAELLWPERPPGIALQNLRQTLTRLNRALAQSPLAAELLTITRQTVELNHAAASIDALHFTNLLATTHDHEHHSLHLCQVCCEKQAEAAALYQGDLLASLVTESTLFDEWVRAKQAWFRHEMIGALAALTNHNLANQKMETAYRYAWRQVEVDPLSEEAHRQVMQTLTLAGRREDALAHYEFCRQILHDELGVPPSPETIALWEEIQRASKPKRSANLISFPVPFTTFVGREGELNELDDLLDNPDCRLLTLVGHGGIGKTRLALEAARRKAINFTAGAAFIELASVSLPEHLPTAIANVLGLSFSKQVDSIAQQRVELLAFLADKSYLLILDNVEHLLNDGHGEKQNESILAFVVEIVQRSPHSKILVTSRQPLHLRAEWIFDVEGLNYPAVEERIAGGKNRGSEFAMEQFGSMQLFVQLAQRTNRHFLPSTEETKAIAQICHSVQGIPLALELAAAWGRQISCLQIQEKIAESLDFLSTTMFDVPERHRSVRAIFESTWILLNTQQRASCSRLAIFRGPFSLAAAHAVAAVDRDALVELVDRSLLRGVASFAGEERFEMHELLRQYAFEKLTALPDSLASTEQRYSTYFSAFVDAQKESLDGAEVGVGVKAIHEQIANIRAAWQWCLDTRSVIQMGQIASGLLRYHTMSNQTEEAITIFGNGIELLRIPDNLGTVEVAPVLAQLLALRARAQYKLARYPLAITDAEEAQTLAAHCGAKRVEVLGALYWGISLINQGKREEARQKLFEALDLSQRVEWPKIESDSLRGLGILAQQEKKIDEAKGYYEQSLAIGQQINDARGTSACLGNLGNICRHKGEFEQAQRYIAQSLAVHQQIGDRSSEGRTLSLMGDLAIDLEEYADAEGHFQQAFDILTEIGEHHYAADAQVGLGQCYARQGQADKARPLWEQALVQYEAAGEMDQIELVRGYLQPGLSQQASSFLKR